MYKELFDCSKMTDDAVQERIKSYIEAVGNLMDILTFLRRICGLALLGTNILNQFIPQAKHK